MYITYASELQVVAERHGVVFHSFADDTQLSKAMRVEDIQAAKQAIVNGIKSIQDWSSSRRLKLNAAKSEVIWLCMHHYCWPSSMKPTRRCKLTSPH